MLEREISTLRDLLNTYSWLQQLAGILPLSALIDFLDVPHALHVFELTGCIPLWCWPVTPSGSRLLLSPHTTEEPCCLDKFGNSQSLICLDGRYGDMYNAASPETLRLCLDSAPRTLVVNDHQNMLDNHPRPQNLTVVHVSGLDSAGGSRSSWTLLGASTIGWILLLGLIVTTIALKCYISAAFLLVIPATGTIVYITRGGDPPTLRVTRGSNYNRLVIAALHMNETDWLAFYGEATIVNALLNLPLRMKRFSRANHWVFGVSLRLLVLGQWALAIGAASTQSWDAYIITFWIVLCIFSNIFVFSTHRCCGDWLRKSAGFRLIRIETKLSSRRALLNTLVALNPDTIPYDSVTMQDKQDGPFPSSLLWMDPILKNCAERAIWEEATWMAMTTKPDSKEHANKDENSNKDETEKPDWSKNYMQYYWCKFIPEGILMADKIRKAGNLSGRFVK
ncbi:uncharacterized protein F4807DRAFT_439762 [Annulohypoxylon truncatum]|uniref:uncharacterized protein n=1 Tax=Annulohypoxylon truncatum TaxID=327061 RepID=UPI00200837A7|nr:uncharacterized protein F4807DRAFT_439762 [Annulohypoxylon truncatum]KAI1206348.1 hypothetical protein F4807DRAFT_439762 [Annulohypoxylon truncatum]